MIGIESGSSLISVLMSVSTSSEEDFPPGGAMPRRTALPVSKSRSNSLFKVEGSCLEMRKTDKHKAIRFPGGNMSRKKGRSRDDAEE